MQTLINAIRTLKERSLTCCSRDRLPYLEDAIAQVRVAYYCFFSEMEVQQMYGLQLESTIAELVSGRISLARLNGIIEELERFAETLETW